MNRLIKGALQIAAVLVVVFSANPIWAQSPLPEVRINETDFGLIGQTELGVSRIWQDNDATRASMTTWDSEQAEEHEQFVSVGSLVDLGSSNHWQVVEIAMPGEQESGYVRLRLQP